MGKSYADLLKENYLFKNESDKKDIMIEKLRKTVKELVSWIKRPNDEMRKYKDKNTPSSANKHLKGDVHELHAKGGKIWAQVGHEDD